MRTTKVTIAAASITLAVWVSAAGCGNKTTPNAGGDSFGADNSSSGGTGSTGSSGGATSGSSGGSSSGASSTAPSADSADGGISCGPGAGCPQSEQCCYAAPTVPAEAGPPGPGGFGAFTGGAPALSCTTAGSCSGSSLSCSSTQHCSSGQVCCFVYQQTEAGAGPGGFGAPMAFTAQCADDCPGGDMVHYQLCASSSECPNGQSCIPGTYTTYCADMGGGPPGGGVPGGGTPGGPTTPPMDDDGGSD
jgi:hypothetical protein